MNASIDSLNQLIREILTRISSLAKSDTNEEIAISLRKSLALLYNNRGHVYYKAIEFNLAADDYTTAISHDPTMAVAYYNRATIHYRMNHFDKAFEDFKFAVDLDPNNKEFLLAFEETVRQLNSNSDPSTD